MNPGKVLRHASAWLIAFLIAAPPLALAAGQAAGKTFKQEQLEQLVAPIALYPDSLLAQVLMASTYPLEVVQADRWVKQNSKLKGDSLNKALNKMDWSESVKALVAFPTVLAMMSEQLDWTQKLGDAFLVQQDDLMNTVQKLRASARAQNNLKTTPEQKVIVEQNIIRIEPADPAVVYIPSYNPVVVYGAWPYPSYPPYYWGAPVVATGVAFAAGVAVGAAWSNGWGYWNWGNHSINVNVNPPPPGPPPPGPRPGPQPGPQPPPQHGGQPTPQHGGQPAPPPGQQPGAAAHGQQPGGTPSMQSANWQHDPAHRKGVAYPDSASRQRYNPQPPGSQGARSDYRGHTPQPGGQGLQQSSSGPPASQNRMQGAGPSQTGRPGGFESPRSSAFEGMGHGRDVMQQSDRGRMSRESSMYGGAGRPSGFGGGSGRPSGFGGGGGGHGGFHGRR